MLDFRIIFLMRMRHLVIILLLGVCSPVLSFGQSQEVPAQPENLPSLEEEMQQLMERLSQQFQDFPMQMDTSIIYQFKYDGSDSFEMPEAFSNSIEQIMQELMKNLGEMQDLDGFFPPNEGFFKWFEQQPMNPENPDIEGEKKKKTKKRKTYTL